MFNESYKRYNKPNRNIYKSNGTLKAGHTYQGYYKVSNIEKYIGDSKQIIYRSGWEQCFCKWCDFSPSILRWSSEPIKIPYYDRVSRLDELQKLGLNPNEPRNWIKKNYNTDFWIEIDKGAGEIEKWFIEVKPKHQLKKPWPPTKNATLKETKKFNRMAKEYLINEAKFAAISTWAERNNCKFYIFTEEQLMKFGIIGGRFELPNKDKNDIS